MPQFNEVFPSVAPGARALESGVWIPEKPFRVLLVKGGSPTGVIDDNVEKDARPLIVGGICEFRELFDARGAPVEIHNGRINSGEIQRGIWTAKPTKSG